MPFESFQSLFGVEVVEIYSEVHRLNLIDPHSPVIDKNHAVGASRDLDRPAIDIELDLCRHFARKTGLGGFEVTLNPTMELGADPQA